MLRRILNRTALAAILAVSTAISAHGQADGVFTPYSIYGVGDLSQPGSAYNKSMGNYVMINHGDGLITIYMHASKLYVNKGDIVTKGQQIAAVGSSGNSTRPHLHFSVRVNGEYVDPWKYLKG